MVFVDECPSVKHGKIGRQASLQQDAPGLWGKFVDLGRNGKNCAAVQRLVIFAKAVSSNQITRKGRTPEIQ